MRSTSRACPIQMHLSFTKPQCPAVQLFLSHVLRLPLRPPLPYACGLTFCLLPCQVRVLKDINLNVVSAEVDTLGDEARDEFFVTYHGEPLSSPMCTLVMNALQYYLSLNEVCLGRTGLFGLDHQGFGSTAVIATWSPH